MKERARRALIVIGGLVLIFAVLAFCGWYLNGGLAWAGGPKPLIVYFIPVYNIDCWSQAHTSDGCWTAMTANAATMQAAGAIMAAHMTPPAWWPWKSPVSTATP